MEKVNFGHVCFAGATMILMTTVASMLGHITDGAFFNTMGTVLGMLILSVSFATFKR